MKNKINYNFLAYAVLIIIIVFLILQLVIKTPASDKTQTIISYSPSKFISEANATSVSLKMPAVDGSGNGVYTYLNVQATQGSGKTLIDVDNLLFWADTQHSIRIARLVAGNLTGKKLSNYDLVYSIQANASIIGGPSAGAALTIATMASLEGKKPREDIMITGTVNSDGSIGPVGDILAKAKAAKDAGATAFLVPLMQSQDIVYETVESCEKFGLSEICSKEMRPKRVNIKNETGIDIIEVSSIKEASEYLFK